MQLIQVDPEILIHKPKNTRLLTPPIFLEIVVRVLLGVQVSMCAHVCGGDACTPIIILIPHATNSL